MRKLILALAPLLAAAAFAINASAASALTTYGTCAPGTPETKPPCKGGGEHFTAFSEEGESITGKKVSAVFIFEWVETGVGYECTGLTAGGAMWNKEGIGNGNIAVRFAGCTVFGEALQAACPSPQKINGNGVVEGSFTSKVKSSTEVELTTGSGFVIKCGSLNLGGMTGQVVGRQTAGTSVLTFSKAAGFSFAGKPESLTGEVEFLTAANKKIVI